VNPRRPKTISKAPIWRRGPVTHLGLRRPRPVQRVDAI
jgi:hypothetical protein